MCGGGRAPAPAPVPGPPVFSSVSVNEDILARDNTRKRLKGAVNTRSTILSQDNYSGGKTLLGQ